MNFQKHWRKTISTFINQRTETNIRITGITALQ